jgi:hypothetical protein
MGEDAGDLSARRDDPVGHFDQLWIVRLQSTAMVVAIQFDEHGWSNARGLAHIGQGIGLFNGIKQQLQVDAGAAAEFRGTQSRGRRQADRIGHVAIAVAGEVFRLGDGRDRDRAGFSGEDLSGDVDALGRLHVRAQHNAKLPGVVGETVYVALELPAIQQQRRCDKAIDLLDRFQRFRARFHVLDVPHH